MFKGIKLSKQPQSLLPPRNECKYNDLKIIMSVATHNWMQSLSTEYQTALHQHSNAKIKAIETNFKLLFSDSFVQGNDMSGITLQYLRNSHPLFESDNQVNETSNFKAKPPKLAPFRDFTLTNVR